MLRIIGAYLEPPELGAKLVGPLPASSGFVGDRLIRQVVVAVILGGNTWVQFDVALHPVQNLLHRFVLELAAQVLPIAVLHKADEEVGEKVHELAVLQLRRVETVLHRKLSLRVLEQGLHVEVNIVNGLGTPIPALCSRFSDLHVKLVELQDRINHRRRGPRPDRQMRVFLSEPRTDCSRVRTSHNYPRILERNLVLARFLHPGQKLRQVAHFLLDGQELHFLGLKGVLAERHRTAIVSVLHAENESPELLRDLRQPVSLIR